MNKYPLNLSAALGFACFVIWLIKDDISFMLYVNKADQSTEVSGVVTDTEIVGGRYYTAHTVVFETDDGGCSGKSDVAEQEFLNYSPGTAVTVSRNTGGCILTNDNRLYAPLNFVYIKVGVLMLLALAGLAGALWKKKESPEQ